MVYNITEDLWFQYFNDDHDGSNHILILIFLYGIRFLWASVCMLCNFAVVRVTFGNKDLRSICGILIAMECTFFSISLFSYFIPFGVVLSGLKFMPYAQCGFFLFPLDIFGNLCQITMVFTGIDRLLCVLFPFWYKTRIPLHNLPLIWIAQCFYAAYWAIIYIKDYEGSKEIMVSCSPMDLGQGPMGPVICTNAMMLSVMLMATYFLLWFLVFMLKKTSKTVNVDNRKLIKSLIIIIALNMIGIFLKNLVQLFLRIFPLDVFAKGYIDIGFSFLNMGVYSANGPILYWQSTVYRHELKKRYQWLPKFGTSAKVNIVQVHK